MSGINHKGGYSRAKNLLGQRFGKLTVIERGENTYDRKGNPTATWICKCDCGNVKSIRANSLTMHRTISCGCRNREKPSNHITHHQSNTHLYRIWCGMRYRCNNENKKNYSYYGKRNINVCDDWNKSFESFSKWAYENGYSEGKSIERTDVNGNYEPSNCKWIEFREQAWNKTSTLRTPEGISVAKLAREKGIVKPSLAYSRVALLGWNIEDAISIPKMKRGQRLEKTQQINLRTESNM